MNEEVDIQDRAAREAAARAAEYEHGWSAEIDTERHECALEGCCQVRPHMNAVNGAVRDALAGLSLSSLAAEPRAARSEGVPA